MYFISSAESAEYGNNMNTKRTNLFWVYSQLKKKIMQPTVEIDSKTVLATNLTNDKETWSERQKDGETGNTGEKGKDGCK